MRLDIRGAVVGEFNGDDISDLVVTNYIDDSVSVLLGNGDGSFNSNNNNRMCVSGTKISFSYNIFVLLGEGDGNFSDAIALDVGTNPNLVAVGEFNGDGISEV